MKTITIYTVARTRLEAERLVADEKWHRLGNSTLFSVKAARLYRKGIIEPKNLRIFPVQLTVNALKALP